MRSYTFNPICVILIVHRMLCLVSCIVIVLLPDSRECIAALAMARRKHYGPERAPLHDTPELPDRSLSKAYALLTCM